MRHPRRMSVSKLRTYILGALKEAGDVKHSDKSSLDAQVDRYLSEYEDEAKQAKKEGFDFRMIAQRILSEADDDEEKDDSAGDKPDAKVGEDKIDVSSFANSVMRLVQNYDNLLEVKNTVIRRAINYLSKVYSPDVIKSFQRTLREEHGVVVGKSKHDVDLDNNTPPPADRAGYSNPGG